MIDRPTYLKQLEKWRDIRTMAGSYRGISSTGC